MFEIHEFENYEALSQKAADIVLEKVKQDKVVLGLATGSSPEGLYQALVAAHHKGLSFKHVVTFNLDEYVGIDQNHSQSYYTFMHEKFFKHVDVESSHIHIPSGNGSMEEVTERYENLLKDHPQDIQVLGIGSNGHIGFNEPGTSFESTCHIVRLKKQTRLDNARFFDSIDDVPSFAITMGIQDIMRAKEILLIATGEKKAQAIYDLVKGKMSEDVPCTILQQHPKVIVLIDKEAGKLLHD